MGSVGKSTNMMGSSGKSQNLSGTSGKSNVFMGASGKKDTPLISSGKSISVFASSAKSSNQETAKAGSMYGTSSKTESLFVSSGKNASVYGNDKTNKVSVANEKSSSTFNMPKSNNTLGSDDKNNKLTNFSGKPTDSTSRDYPSFISPKTNKHKTSFGIIWIPTRKNKKKDLVFNSHNYERYKEKSPSMYSYMSGDSPAYQGHKKKEEETDLLVPDRPKVTTVAVNTGITAASIDIASDSSGPARTEENQEFIKREPEDSKEAAGDTNERASKDDSCEYLENNENMSKPPNNKLDKEKQVDKVDSVYLRPPPPHKVRSTTSTNEEEDCGIKCLYYTLECCDCVLM